MPVSKDFDVAIVGGGMCGLACAIGLARAGINTVVFEAASRFEQVGAGVGLGPNSIRALRGLGLLEAVLTKVEKNELNTRLFAFISGHGNHETVYDYVESAGEKNNEGLGIYRPAFLEALKPLLDHDSIYFNKRCTYVEGKPSGRQLLTFSDKTTFEADLVIGADGIKSIVRKTILDAGSDCLGFSGTYAYRGLIAIEKLKAAGVKVEVERRPYCWVGPGKHLITFPVKGDTMLNVVAFDTPEPADTFSAERPSPWVEPRSQRELLERYQDWGADALIIIQNLENPSRWSIHTLHPPLRDYVKRRIVLIGDAAHGMLPHLGAGVGQGFEDVYTLCRLLGHSQTNKANLEIALEIYNKVRPPRANMVLERSIKAGKIYDNFGPGPGQYNVQDMRHHLAGLWEPVWRHDLEAQISQALRDMETRLSSIPRCNTITDLVNDDRRN